jgi:phospholipase/carboxylesterase
MKPATSGSARSLVILLHGYGADGNDLIGLSDPLAHILPDTVFVAPNAPESCANNPFGFQWFPIPWMDGSTEAQMAQSFAASQDILNGYLDEIASETGIAPSKTVLVGFSQGTMMSLHVAPRRAEAFAGIVGFSGRLLVPEDLGEVKTHPPILLIHGDADPVVPYASMAEAEGHLSSAGFQVATHTSPGTPHGIAPDGLQMAAGFLRHTLG